MRTCVKSVVEILQHQPLQHTSMQPLQLLYSVSLILGVLCSHPHSHTLFEIRQFESFIPRRIAQDLKLGVRKNRWTKHPDNTFESYFIQRGNKSDEYICSIPSARIESIEKRESKQTTDTSNEKLLSTAVDIINQSFPKKGCLYTYDLRGLHWTYAYCFADKVIQYHEQVPPKERHYRHVAAFPNEVFVLGRFSEPTLKNVEFKNQATPKQRETYEKHGRESFTLAEDKASPFRHHSAQKVVLQVLEHGSHCDLTEKFRSAQIVYKCDPEAQGFSQPEIIDVPELTTCLYKVVIHVPGLCALEQFAPHRNVKESLVDLSCQLVDEESNDDSVDNSFSFESFTSNVKLRDHDSFPVRSDNKISVDDHSLMSLGYGFYLAKSKTGYRSTSAFYNNRNVIIYNGFAELLSDLGYQLGRTLYNAVGKTLLAPYFENDEQKRLLWTDSFTIWLEVYDFFGNFVALIRTVRDGSLPQASLMLQVIDPVTMIDIEGDPPEDMAFDLTRYEAPHNLWNYQYFRRGRAAGEIPDKNGKPDAETVTLKEVLTVTVPQEGESEESAVSEDSTGADHLVGLSDDQEPMVLNIDEEDIKEIRGDPEEGPIDVVVEVDGTEQTLNVYWE